MTEFSLEELRFAIELKRCAPDDWEAASVDELCEAFEYFCRHYVYIKHPRGKRLFELRDAQRETVRCWLENRNSITLKARQVGFSTLVSVFALWLAAFWPERNIIMISRRQEDAISLLDHAKFAWGWLPDWFRLLIPGCKITSQRLSFDNNSVIRSEPSASNPARGQTAFLVIVDEMGQLPNSHDAWASIEPVADIGGRIIMLGTANGEGNLFHQLWTEASAGIGKFAGATNFHSWRAAGRDDDWYEAQKASLPTWQLHQEYPDNPDEAFLRSGNPVFDVDRLREWQYEEPKARGYLREAEGGVEFVEDGGPLRIWEHPETKTNVYCIGADVAEGLEHGDFSVAYVYNVATRRVVAKWHGHIDPDLFGEDVLAKLGTFYGGCLIGVENNNHGLTTLKALQRAGYRNIYRQRRLANRSPQQTDILGWRTTTTTKPVAIDELARMIRDESFYLPCSETAAELRTFVREGDGKMHGSPHDDRVMALAITMQMVQHVYKPEYRTKAEPGPGTIMHFVRTHMPDAEKKSKSPFQRFGARQKAV